MTLSDIDIILSEFDMKIYVFPMIYKLLGFEDIWRWSPFVNVIIFSLLLVWIERGFLPGSKSVGAREQLLTLLVSGDSSHLGAQQPNPLYATFVFSPLYGLSFPVHACSLLGPAPQLVKKNKKRSRWTWKHQPHLLCFYHLSYESI